MRPFVAVATLAVLTMLVARATLPVVWTQEKIVSVGPAPAAAGLRDVFDGALVCPMALRGTLYGFIICGAKRDRSSHVPEEIEAVASPAHRVGIAYEWLTREERLSPSAG